MGQAVKYESFCGQRLALWIGMMLLLNCLIQEELYWIEDRLKAQMPSSSDSDVEYEAYQQALEQVWEELEYFPVPDSALKDTEAVSFENTWQAERTYGGKRKHEGCDLMPEKEESGYYPVISMTDGTVERAGWLEKGGWRIGIRSDNGNYYYYAHLESYVGDWKEGDQVQAGDLLGYMGDSGYGPEGTTGQFPVHLHVGIYMPLGVEDELAINPYWMLKYLEEKKVKWDY